MPCLTLRVFLLLATINVAAGQTPAPSEPTMDWQPYAIQGEELSCELPQRPSAITISRPVKNPNDPAEKPKGGRMYGSYGGGVVYLILSLENPGAAEGLDTFVKEISSYPINGRPQKFERDLVLGGFPGKQYSFTSAGLSGLVQVYQGKSHVYVVEATSEDVSQPEIKRFLASLSFAAKKANYDPDNEPPPEAPIILVPPSGVGAGVSGGVGSGIPNVISGRDVSRKAIVVTKPPPAYTEAARQNQVTGTVVLKCVFASSGRVEKIMVLKPLAFGLTEKAMVAARSLRFIPALKDGKYVSQYIQLEYQFNLY